MVLVAGLMSEDGGVGTPPTCLQVEPAALAQDTDVRLESEENPGWSRGFWFEKWGEWGAY